MFKNTFRFPGVDTATPANTFIERTRTVLRDSQANGDRRLTAQELQHVHEPMQVLNTRLQDASMHIDEIGFNEGSKPDHIFLAYQAAAKAAEPLDDGSDRLADFAPSRQHASLERNTEALEFQDEHAIEPNALRVSSPILDRLDHLANKLAPLPLPDSNLAEQVVRQKGVLDDAQRERLAAREEYRRVRGSDTSTREEQKAALARSGETQNPLIRAQKASAALIARPELGEDRVAEILADYPITTTRDLLVKVVEDRKNVLRERSLPFFFDKVFVKQLEKQRTGRSAREAELTESLQESGFSQSEIKQALKEWRTHAIHGTHGENLRDHVAEKAQEVIHNVNENIDFRTRQLADLTREQTAQIMDQARNGFLTIEQLQGNLLTDLRQSLMDQASFVIEDNKNNTNRLIKEGKTNTQNLIELTKEQNDILVQALHGEIDRAILAGERGLNNFYRLNQQDQQEYLADIHQYFDQHLANTQAMQGALRTMSFNDDSNESGRSRFKRFIGDCFQNGPLKTIGDRFGKSIKKNTTQTFPQAMNPQGTNQASGSRSRLNPFITRVGQNIVTHEIERAIDGGSNRAVEYISDAFNQ
jgi:hypothetical protein